MNVSATIRGNIMIRRKNQIPSIALAIVNQSPSVYIQQDISLIRGLVEKRRRLPSVVQTPQEMITKENAGLFAGW
jgi:hypothetical protein